ncbi:hypothetical protein ACLFMI_03515 [Pseudonocardia nantongensis]|uniref:hypothetical protein n=1 Tax=Pseudonocardia nantongensis TaxID=1181885 RepID=UPI0039798D6F
MIGVMMMVGPAFGGAAERWSPVTFWVGAAVAALGVVIGVAVVACRPIPKVTWRAWLAGR